jgi:hypothetical protein
MITSNFNKKQLKEIMITSAYNLTPLSSNTVSEEKHKLLQKFRKKMDDIQHGLYPVCNERIPSMTLIMGMCQCCHTKKSLPKKFLAELKKLSKIKEMLIAQAFTVMLVY